MLALALSFAISSQVFSIRAEDKTLRKGVEVLSKKTAPAQGQEAAAVRVDANDREKEKAARRAAATTEAFKAAARALFGIAAAGNPPISSSGSVIVAPSP